MASMVLMLVVVSVVLVEVAGKLSCVCNKDDVQQIAIYNTTQSITTIGYIHPHQCRIHVNLSQSYDSWLAVQFNQETGYVANDPDFVLVADCPEIIPAYTGNLTLCPQYVRLAAKSHCRRLTQHGHSCYEMNRLKVSWTHANRSCTERGGHLVTIHSAHENTYLHHLLTQHSYNHSVWIGLQDRVKEGQFHWVTGEQLSYTHWSAHLNHHTANVKHRNEDCVVISTSGNWEDVNCGGDDPVSEGHSPRHAFICEYNAHVTGSFIIG